MRESNDYIENLEHRHPNPEIIIDNGISRLTIRPRFIESDLTVCGFRQEDIDRIIHRIQERITEIQSRGADDPQAVGGYAMRFFITKDLMNAASTEMPRYGVSSLRELRLVARLISAHCSEDAIFVPGKTLKHGVVNKKSRS